LDYDEEADALYVHFEEKASSNCGLLTRAKNYCKTTRKRFSLILIGVQQVRSARIAAKSMRE
jgi:hypothetical protein